MKCENFIIVLVVFHTLNGIFATDLYCYICEGDYCEHISKDMLSYCGPEKSATTEPPEGTQVSESNTAITKSTQPTIETTKILSTVKSSTEPFTALTDSTTQSTEASSVAVTKESSNATVSTVSHTDPSTELTEATTELTEDSSVAVTEESSIATASTVSHTESSTEFTEATTEFTEATTELTEESSVAVTEESSIATVSTVSHTDPSTEFTEATTESIEESSVAVTEESSIATVSAVSHTESSTEFTEATTESIEESSVADTVDTIATVSTVSHRFNTNDKKGSAEVLLDNYRRRSRNSEGNSKYACFSISIPEGGDKFKRKHGCIAIHSGYSACAAVRKENHLPLEDSKDACKYCFNSECNSASNVSLSLGVLVAATILSYLVI